jgi:hypothetical protein
MPSKLATATPKRNRKLREPSLRFRFNFDSVRRWGVQPNGDTAKTAQPATASLDAVTFRSTEDGFHDTGQATQKCGLAHRRQFTSLRDFLKKVPQFRAGEVSVRVGREIFSDETRNRTTRWCGIARTSLVVRQEALQYFDGVANQINFP